MVQEVQQQWNWYQDPNLIQGVWLSERKVSEHTQIRNKKSNVATFTTWLSVNEELWEVFAYFWTYSSSDWIVYKVVWWDFYMAQAWAYMVSYYPYEWYNQSEYETVTLYADGKAVWSEKLLLKDHTTRTFVLNLWYKNKITMSCSKEWSWTANPSFVFKFIKL